MSSTRVQYKFKIVQIIDHNQKVRELTLQFVATLNPHENSQATLDVDNAEKNNLNANTFKFRAGQFVMLHVPHEPKQVLRAYSIASSENESNKLRLLVKYIENGIASNYIWALKESEPVQITGPFGRVFFQEPPTENVFLLSTSTGLAPHLSYIETFLKKYPKTRFEILIGVRTEKDIFCENMLMEYRKKYSNFKFEFVLSRSSERWTGKKGHVQDHLASLDYMQKPSTFYLCGNEGMTSAVRHQLIETGFNTSSIYVENF